MSHEAPQAPMFQGAPPRWALSRNKSLLRHAYDFVGAPLRMTLLPDHISERWGLTSLRAERLGVVLAATEGRCLDVGAGDNMLVRLYREMTQGTPRHEAATRSVGVDVFDWGGGCTILPDCRSLPFDDASFDTVSFVACLNHIPERREALKEAYRVLRPGGKVMITMIGRWIGKVGHMIWWYSEDKHRTIEEGEVMGLDQSDVNTLLGEAGFADVETHGFVYGLNTLTIAKKR
jgi:SAM-dependent methyltransferase